jgi:hypothetical protein
VSDAWLNWIFFAFAATWFGGTIILFVRTKVKGNAYLRRFPPVDRYVTLDLYMSANPFDPVRRRIGQVMRQRQDNPELEQLRREMWRRFWYCSIWMFGFPAIFAGVSVILILLLWHPPQ